MGSDKIVLQKMGKYIAKVRKEKGFTQKSLSDALLVGDKTVSKWERGIIAPDITILKKLADTLDISVDELLSGEKNTSFENKADAVVSSINVYSNQTKKKYLKIFFIIIVALLFVFLAFFIIDRYNRWDINQFQVDGEFHISGFYFKNKIGTKFVVRSIDFDDADVGTKNEIKANDVIIHLNSNGIEICTDYFHYDQSVPLYSIFENYSFVCESDDVTNFENLSLHIDYYQNNQKVSKEIIIK